MVPGYIISLTLMIISPDIFTAMAFDSGGTASGPMSTSFILPMIIGVYSVVGYGKKDLDSSYNISFYGEAFGVVAMIALTPIIAIQLLGVLMEFKQVRRRLAARKAIAEIDDIQVVHFKKEA